MKMSSFERVLVKNKSVLGVAVSLLVLAAYLVCLSPGAYPGDPSSLLAGHLELHPFTPLTSPLSGALIRMVDLLPVQVSTALNLLAAFLTAASVWLVYDMVARIPRDRSQEEANARFDQVPVQVLSGLSAALLVAFSIPMWFIGTRFHSLTLGTFMLLFSLWLLFVYNRKRKGWTLVLFALLYGLGMTESTTFIVFFPACALYLLYVLWRDRRLFTPLALLVFVCFLLTWSVYFLSAYRFYHSPAYEWREFDSYGSILRIMFRDKYFLLARSLPKVGWALIALTSITPFVIVLGFPKRSSGSARGSGGSLLLHLCMVVLVGAALFNTGISSFGLTGIGLLMVTPVLMAAVSAAYLVGYFYVLVFRERRMIVSSLAKGLHLAAQVAFLPLLVGILLTLATMNFPYGYAREASSVTAFCDKVLDSLSGKPWLITSGEFDDILLVRAHESSRDVQLINVALDRNTAYRKFLASRFDTPRHRLLALVGIQPLLTEWLEDPAAASRIGLLAHPDIWVGFGFAPVPHVPVYYGLPSLDAMDLDLYEREQKSEWLASAALLEEVANLGPALRGWAQQIQAHYSRLANNQGVLFDEAGRTQAAEKAYRLALDILPDNLSALMNLWVQAEREGLADQAAALKTELEAAVQEQEDALNFWFLSRTYGYVRDPVLLANRGYAWAMSGKPDVALQEMRKALSMNPNQRTLVHAMAEVLYSAKRHDESRAMMEELLEKNPEDTSLLVSLSRLAMQQGDFDVARAYTDKLEALAVDTRILDLQRALIALFEGRPEAARTAFSDLAQKHPDWLEPWIYLAIADLQLGADKETILKSVYHVTTVQSATVEQLYNAGLMLVNLGQYQAAQNAFERILFKEPGHVKTYVELIRLNIQLSRRDDVAKFTRALLKLDSHHAFANLVMGDYYREEGQYRLARAAYEAGIASVPHQGALINLAWLAMRLNDYTAARGYIERAGAMDENNPDYWHTLGLLELETDHIDEAEKALNRALELNPQNLYAQLYRAKVYDKQGQQTAARDLLETLLKQAAQLPPDIYDQASTMVARLRRAD